MHGITCLHSEVVMLCIILSQNDFLASVLSFTEVWQWIQSMREQVCDVEHRVKLAKANVEQINTIMIGWSLTPLYQRKEDKKECLLNLEVI